MVRFCEATGGSASFPASTMSESTAQVQLQVPGIKYLIVDSSPLLTAPLASLRPLAQSFLITPDVVNELRDKKGREVIEEAKLQLLPPPGSNAKPGFLIREPTAEAVAKGPSLFPSASLSPRKRSSPFPLANPPVTAFARRTGDIAVLSSADIRVLALCLTLEIEENGTWRVRDFPGQVLTGPPKTDDPNAAEEPSPSPAVDAASSTLDALSLEDPQDPVASTSAATLEPVEVPNSELEGDAEDAEEQGEDFDGEEEEGDEQEGDEQEGDEGDESDADSDDSHDSSSSWITPDNVTSHKVKDLGLFTPPAADPTKPPKTIMKAAVLTGDFAMQNVALQMGLNVLGSGGKRVREVRTWVLRCHACYKSVSSPPPSLFPPD